MDDNKDWNKIFIGVFGFMFIILLICAGLSSYDTEPTKTEIESTIQQAKNSNDPKLKQQALDLERKIQEQEHAKLQKKIQKINDSISQK